LLTETKALKLLYDQCALALWGDDLKTKHEFETEPSINSRLGIVEYQLYENTAGVTKTQRANKTIAEEEYLDMRKKLDDLIQRKINLETKLDASSIPYTKSREKWKND